MMRQVQDRRAGAAPAASRSGRPAGPGPGSAGRGWTGLAVAVGAAVGSLSRRCGFGAGAMIGGRVALAAAPRALARLGAGRDIALVTGTNGKTTTSHLLASAVAGHGPVAHNATRANMPDGALAALMAAPAAPTAVLEVDELHLAAVAAALAPTIVVVLNLVRDQLDRGSEVRAVAALVTEALRRHPHTRVIANADDPMVVWAASGAADIVWVAAGSSWSGDTVGCPGCGHTLARTPGHWSCDTCGLRRPSPTWRLTTSDTTTTAPAESSDVVVVTPDGAQVPLRLRLPGAFNRGNALMALAAAAELGAAPDAAAAAFATTTTIANRYAVRDVGDHRLRLLMAKNPGGWAATLPLVAPATPVLLVVNAHEADGRDTSWLWDIPFEDLAGRTVVAAGERAFDLAVRLGYGGITHHTEPDPLAALAHVPAGPVDVIANYTAFRQLANRLAAAQATHTAQAPR